MAEHLAIVDAIASREPEVARAWSTVHIAGIELWLREALGSGRTMPEVPTAAEPVEARSGSGEEP